MLEPVILEFKFAVRITNLAPDHVVEMTCDGCDRRHMVATWQLHARFPPSTPLMTVERYFRCRKCPKRGAVRWTIYRAVPPLFLVEVDG